MTIPELACRLNGKIIIIHEFDSFCSNKGEFISFSESESPKVYINLTDIIMPMTGSPLCKKEKKIVVAYQGEDSNSLYSFEIIELSGNHFHIISWQTKKKNKEKEKVLHIEMLAV